MQVLINHCWCSDSNWGGVYHCRCIVSIHRVPRGKQYHDTPDPDWALVEEVELDSPIEKFGRQFHYRTFRLRQDVVGWLLTNIKDRKDDTHTKGWCVGTDKYNADDGIQLSVFFHRPSDAMRFIKQWSRYKKPTTWFNYFEDIRKELNPTTGQLEVVENFSR